MNTQLNTTTIQSAEKAYISHILRYVGVGLISGSIVHIGTLGGGVIRYIILISMGVIAFIAGTLLEKREEANSLTAFIVISVIMSIGVGMVSGGTQHYLDGPTYAAFLIPIGIAVGYFAFLLRDHRSEFTLKRVGTMLVLAVALGSVLYFLANKIPAQDNHHQIDGIEKETTSDELNHGH